MNMNYQNLWPRPIMHGVVSALNSPPLIHDTACHPTRPLRASNEWPRNKNSRLFAFIRSSKFKLHRCSLNSVMILAWPNDDLPQVIGVGTREPYWLICPSAVLGIS